MKYTIQSGDTLSSIAKQFLGNADKWPTLWRDNIEVLLLAQTKIARQQHNMIGPGWIFPETVIKI